jgi:hypothetical protein
VPGLAGQIAAPGSGAALELGATLVLGAALDDALATVVGTGAVSDGVAEAVATALPAPVAVALATLETLGATEAPAEAVGTADALGAPAVTVPDGLAVVDVWPVAVAVGVPAALPGVPHAASTNEEPMPHTAKAAEFDKGKRISRCF